MAKFSRIEERSLSKRNLYIAFVVILVIAVIISIIIGFFIGKSVGAKTTYTESKPRRIGVLGYPDSTELVALRKKVNENVSKQQLRENLRLVNSFEVF